MSEELFEQVLDHNGIQEKEKEQMMSIHLGLYDAFLRSLDENDFRIILLLQEEAAVPLSEDHYFKYGNRTLRIDPQLYLSHVACFDQITELKDHLKIHVANELFMPYCDGANIMVKENGAIISMSTENIESIPVVIRQPDVIEAFTIVLKTTGMLFRVRKNERR